MKLCGAKSFGINRFVFLFLLRGVDSRYLRRIITPELPVVKFWYGKSGKCFVDKCVGTVLSSEEPSPIIFTALFWRDLSLLM